MNRKNRWILRRAASRSIMEDFFKKEVVPKYYPKAELISFQLKDQSSYQFKKAVRYTLELLYPNGKKEEKIVRGNVPSRHQTWEITVSDQALNYLYRHGFDQGKYQVTRPLGHYPSRRLQLYEEYPGEILSDRIKKGKGNLKKDIRLASNWTAEFHNLKAKLGRVKTLKAIREDMGHFIKNYSKHSLKIQADGKKILEHFYEAIQKQCNPKKSFLIHGDLNANNIVINKNQVGVIDFGNAWRFDPLCEIANYLVQLELITWRGEASSRLVNNLNSLFLKTYLKKTKQNHNQLAQRRIDLWKVWWMMQITAFACSIFVDTKKNRADLDKTIIKHTIPKSKAVFNL
ncbi:MAG: hypothetical protein COT24_01575 [Candidatus Kerfeldbacteria bacterium CG08_land_8_20_14_0_20_40_16]|uniref:Aminoglycoside phosphotransferase domain-containing protein n=1 Tax=Candidatus Kerfeldbacteria bacterium CG08_land_8_20_14_0_20_40_16 TaxID=2014244 RepID=A0A2H0YWC9_9BACT|nr:MAG: hypothetical protein COT24_01575 [Candidatus Kerfeldbacteria bacterium CG08_land_8_20_14_0_20_40_16]